MEGVFERDSGREWGWSGRWEGVWPWVGVGMIEFWWGWGEVAGETEIGGGVCTLCHNIFCLE